MVDIKLKKLLNILKKNPLEIKIEHRVKLGYKTYGIINHAELSGYINPADNVFWDVILPGYDYKIRKSKFKTNDIIGICYVENGNDKIFMKIDHPGYTKLRGKKDIKKFLKNYRNINKLSCKWKSVKNIKF